MLSAKDDREPGADDDEEYTDPAAFACLLSAWTGRDIAPQPYEKAGVIEAESDEYYSVAWRVLDSQYFVVPQRRRRIFVVGHIGKDWRPPFAILFERESLRRDFTPSKKKRKGATGNTKDSAGRNIGGGNCRMRGFGDYVEDDKAGTIQKRDYKYATDLIIEEAAPGQESFTLSGFADYKEGVGTLKKAGGDLGGGGKRNNSSNQPIGDIVPYSNNIGCLQARDYKGVGNQFVEENKLVIHKQDFTPERPAQ